MAMKTVRVGAATLYDEHPVISVYVALALLALWVVLTGRLAMAGFISPGQMVFLRISLYVPWILFWGVTTLRNIAKLYRRARL